MIESNQTAASNQSNESKAPWKLASTKNAQGYDIHHKDYGNGLTDPATVEDIAMGRHVQRLEAKAHVMEAKLDAAESKVVELQKQLEESQRAKGKAR